MVALVFTAQVFSTLAMFGVIWFVQVVHYPLFERVGRDGFAVYACAHATRTTWVVAPLMLAELASAATLLLQRYRPAVISTNEARSGAGMLLLIWASTALVQVPLHDRLQRAYSPACARRLVATNWVRTAAWTLRAALMLVWVRRLN